MASSLDTKALNILVHSPVSQDMIHKLVVTTLQVLPCQDGKNPTKGSSKLPSLMSFLTKLIRYTNVYTGTLMATLVYLERLKLKLPKNAQGLPCTRHRILLSCLILSSKYHNDSSPKNIHWAKYTDGLFSVKDINLMERQLTYLLNWDLRVSNEEMCEQLQKFLEPIKQDLIKSSKMRKYLQKQQQQAQTIQQSSIPSPKTPLPRSNSNSSTLSLSSTSSLSPNSHYRQDSLSSVESLSPVSPNYTKMTAKVDPVIELTARKEEIELNRLLQQFSKH